MHDEKTARTLWCPMARVGEQASGAAENRPDGSYNCIASDCMMWRITRTIEVMPDGKKTGDGYCGLAGKPF